MQISSKQLNMFAKLSGDYNPIHLDRHYASQSIFKTRILYGILQVFLTLENFLAAKQNPICLLKISASFSTPIHCTEKFYIHNEQSENNVISTIISDNKPASKIEFSFENSKKISGFTKNIIFSDKKPLEMENIVTQRKGGGGDTKLLFNPELLEKLFPNCFNKLDNLSIATLLATTRIVGMQCPGLNSIFSSLELHFTKTYSKIKQNLTYSFKIHPILNCITILLDNTLIKGNIKAFIRPKPVENIQYSLLLSKYTFLTKEQTFKQQRALVIGASNGLGNACTKLLSIGGAKVLASFKHNEVLEKIPNVTFFSYDVLNPTQEMLNTITSFSPTHLYYFSTPKIQSNKALFIQEKVLQDFINHYIFGLNKILQLNLPVLKTIFCPSTIFIETRPQDFKEYILAKEFLESFLSTLSQQYRCIIPRMKKTLTNQTLEIIKQNLPTADEAILKEILVLKTQNIC